MLSFKPPFSLSSFTFIKRLFSSLFSATSVVLSAYLRLLIFLLAISQTLLNWSTFQKMLLLITSVVSDSVQPQRWQPTRLPCPWDSPGKNTGVGCHFLLQCMKVKSESEATQSCLTLSDPMDCSLPGYSIRGIFQARVLEWGAIVRHH